ncbi:CHASE2 domain-containing protein [Oscillatoria sp. FACHB-1407]|uniref:serine/threonine-protein kinase n=1 Tax=Oscillatoria sp. FACHB-1407 TaxID=2692847 RepID=UPI001683C319|nr:serine/threonine-protein kinase [Oscillatoria sp. FACHB-1407]MBD2464061.1 CHASE2 domain-containing protein [Oscillatoria sp. FACHB-1407]
MKQEPAPGSVRNAQSGDRSQSNDTEGTVTKRWLKEADWGRLVGWIWVLAAATTTGLNIGLVQLLERQVQTIFFELRGPVTPPSEVVILAIDEESLAQGEFFRSDPQRYATLEPIQSWPWQRTAYATVIDKLMAAGARAVGVDVIFSTPSIYGEADDQRLAQSLQRHAGRVVLAAQYAETETPQGITTQLTVPLPEFCDASKCAGFINFLIEPDGRIHRYGDRFLTQLLENAPPVQAAVLEQLPSFASATLQSAQVPVAAPKDSSIFFYGSAQSFEHVPFWYVLDATTWEDYLQSGEYFRDKIVLIGSTATLHQDFQAAPFSKSALYPQAMTGVEVHANAIASLLEDKSVREAVPQIQLRSGLVLVGLVLATWLLTRPQAPFRRLGWAAAIAAAWLGLSYGLFVQARLIVPTAVPVGAIVLSGLSQLVVGTIREQIRKQRLRATLKLYMTSPVVQEIISQQEDLQDLLHQRESILAGKVLSGRYEIAKVLGSGGFSETYIAKDLQRPGNPLCVVKQLRVVSDNPKTLRLARRLFITEAETLERLGQHDQIPQLLATFEENHEFYLVQEFIAGHPLTIEIGRRQLPSETQILQILYDLLGVLEFVHRQGVIHRDLKPSNIIRRQADGRLVLIDFGIAKKITTQLAATNEKHSQFTVSVGTPGYMPGEQSAGYPQFNSDIYALGMICIEGLTGRHPHTLNQDAKTGTISWKTPDLVISPEVEAVLTQMIHHDFTQRYPSVQAVKADLASLFSALAIPQKMAELEDDLLADETPLTDVTLSNDTVALPEDWVDLDDAALPDVTVTLPKDWVDPGSEGSEG